MARFLNVPLDVSNVFIMTFMILQDSYTAGFLYCRIPILVDGRGVLVDGRGVLVDGRGVLVDGRGLSTSRW